MKTVSLALLGLACAGMAQAGQLFDGSGTGTGQSMNEVFALEEGHIVMHSTSTYDALATADANSPMAGMSGTCFGSIEIMGGSASGSGHCSFSKDGSAVLSNWTITGMAPTGALTGTWNVVSANGAAAGLTGGGGFSNLTNRETGAFENTITGALMMP